MDTAAQQMALAYALAANFIHDRRPGEEFIFPAVWDGLIARMRKSDVPNLSDSAAIVGLAADDVSHTGVAPLVAVTIWALVQELERRGVQTNLDDLKPAIKAAAARLRVGTVLANELADYWAPQLAAVFRPSQPGGTEQLMVDWSEPGGSLSDLDGGRNSRLLSLAVVEQRFRSDPSRFRLFVDEPEETICHSGSEPNLWLRLPRRASRFLCAFLTGLRRGAVTNEEIDECLYSGTELPPSYDAAARSRAKGQLDKKLGGLIRQILAPQSGGYEIRGRFSYCWIRRPRRPSRLL